MKNECAYVSPFFFQFERVSTTFSESVNSVVDFFEPDSNQLKNNY